MSLFRKEQVAKLFLEKLKFIKKVVDIYIEGHTFYSPKIEEKAPACWSFFLFFRKSEILASYPR